MKELEKLKERIEILCKVIPKNKNKKVVDTYNHVILMINGEINDIKNTNQ